MPRRHLYLPISILVFFSLLLAGCSDDFEPLGVIDPDVPFAVSDLAIATVNDTTRLTWTATGDDGPNGTAARYDLRRHAAMITDATWDDAETVDGLAAPAPSGTPESFVLETEGSPPPVFMALKVIDDAGNVSKLSNVVFADITPPAAVADLDTVRVSDNFALLTWTAPSDDGPLGHPARYEVRRSAVPLTSENWNEATPLNGPIRPVGAGETEQFLLWGLEPEVHHHVAIRCLDEAGNLSDLSNGIEFTTPPTPAGWWTGFTGIEMDGGVQALHVMNDTLYLGGNFTSIGGSAGKAVASWDGSAFGGLGGGLAGGQFGSLVLDMEAYQGDLYVGGSFTQAGSAPANNIARWTGTSWVGLPNGRTTGHPWSMGVFDGMLYQGWRFNSASTWPFEHLNRFDGASFHPMGWDLDRSRTPEAFLEHEGLLYMCGGLDNYLGKPAAGIVMWDGNDYSVPSSDLSGGYWGEPFPTAMCVYRGDLIVAGEFSHAGGQQVNHIARWDGQAWHPLGSGLLGDRVHVMDVTVYRDYLVVGGRFETAGGTSAANIALWDGQYWIPLGEGVTRDNVNSVIVEALAVFRGSLYVGGNFDTVDGQPSPPIARWDLD